jgi:hypothetical protein
MTKNPRWRWTTFWRCAKLFSRPEHYVGEGSLGMSLHEVYARAWVKRRGLGPGWIVNLEPTYNLTLGAVGVVDGQYFNPETSLQQRGVTGLQLDENQHRDTTPWQFNSNGQIAIDLSSSGAISGAAEVAGEANWNLEVNFGENAGASIHGTAMWWNGYADLGLVRAGIVDAAREKRLHKGESIVVTQQLTGSGVLFLAEGSNASLTAAASAKVAPGMTPPIGSLSGRLKLMKSSGGAQFQSFADGTVLAARLLYLGKRGWLWWRRFEAFGDADSMDDAEKVLMLPREGDGEREYFALL